MVQETFYRVARGLDKFPIADAPRPWIFRILHNVYIDTVRRAACRPHLVSAATEQTMEGFALESATPQEATTLEITDFKDREKMESCFDEEVLGALDTLPEEFRLPLLLHAVGELSYSEIAKAQDCPIGTVMSRVSRARAILREHLAEYARRQRIVISHPAAKQNSHENA